MERAKAAARKNNAVEPTTNSPPPGIKHCCLCEELVHPYSAYMECKTKKCSNKARVHRKCVYKRLQSGTKKVRTQCENCRLTSVWQWRPWVDNIASIPMTLLWLVLAASIPMALVKWGGWGTADKWEFTQKIVFSHVFSSLLLVAIARVMWWIGGKTSGCMRWMCGKCCFCFNCCKRDKHDDIY